VSRPSCYLKARIESASSDINSSNCTPLTPNCSINEVKTPCQCRCQFTLHVQAALCGLTSSDSMVLQPPVDASSAMFARQELDGAEEGEQRGLQALF
jgi:hypothetical protein